MKKKTIISILIFLFIIGFCIVFQPTKLRTMHIKYEVDLKQNDKAQLFYTNQDMQYDETRSVSHAMGTKTHKMINDTVDITSPYLRFDLGTIPGECTLSGISIRGIFTKKNIDMANYLAVNELENIKISNAQLTACAIGDDPYVIYDVSTTVDALQKQEYKISQIIYFIISLTVALFVFFQYNHLVLVILWLKDIIRNRELIVKLANNDFKTRFAGSYLGVIWAFVQPIVTVIIYVFVFQYGIKSGVPMEGLPFVLWLVAGIVPWFFFQDSVTAATNSLIEYSYLVKKVVFKINILPLVKIVSAFFVHLFFIAIAIILYLVNGRSLSIHLIQILYYSLCTAVLSIGVCYMTSSVVIFFRDLGQIVNILLQFGMWLTPIMWDTSNLRPTLARLMKLNPFYYIVIGYRDAFYKKIWFWQRPGLTIYFWLIALFVLFAGMYIFRKLEKHFADVL